MVNPLVIEFNGLPGAGKTTVCNHLKSMLECNNILFFDFNTYEKECSRTMSSMIELLIFSSLHGQLSVIVQYINLMILLRKQRNTRVIVSALRNALLLKKHLKKNDFALLLSDQCIIQDLISCLYDVPLLPESKIYHVISKISKSFKDVIVVNVNVNSEISLDRISSRENGGSRLDRMEVADASLILNIQKRNFRLIRKIFDDNTSIDVDSTKPPYVSAKYIYSAILKEMRCGSDNEKKYNI